MKLDQLLDINRLSWLRDNRFVSMQSHPSLPLRIYNYTHLAQYDSKIWGDGTIDYCRGLIVDAENNIIARPFMKFWNLNTIFIPESQEVNLPKTTPTITEKIDGSTGLLWRYKGEYGIASRGSFTSPQAQWATNWLNEGIDKQILSIPPEGSPYTWLFEIIYDANRIVLKYSKEELVLLARIDKETGAECNHEITREVGTRHGFSVARQIRNKNIHDLLQENKKNEEGYVVTYSRGDKAPPLKVKIKFEDYCRIHKVVTGMNPRSIWELLKANKGLENLESYPEHFKKWLRGWGSKLMTQFQSLSTDLYKIFEDKPEAFDDGDTRQYRKDCALYFQSFNRPELTGAFFQLLDGKDPSEKLWDLVEPRGDDKSFREGDE